MRNEASQSDAVQKVTFCRICEPLCGMVATVEDGKRHEAAARPRPPALARLRVSQGHRDGRGPERPRPGAPSAAAQRRPASSSACRWDEALDDIGRRLKTVLEQRGPEAVGLVHGQPGRVLVLAHAVGQGLPRRARLAALLHGRLAGREQPLRRQRAALRHAAGRADPRPARARASCSWWAPTRSSRTARCCSAPRMREQLLDDRARGGRVVVVDPRRTETARQFEHLPVRPDTDAWLLLSMLNVIFEEGLADEDFLADRTERRRRARAHGRGPFPPEETEARTGVPAARVRRARARLRRGRRRRRLRAHGLLPRPLRHARRLPARRAERGHRQPRPPGRRGVRPPAGRARRRGRAGSGSHLRQAAARASAASRT